VVKTATPRLRSRSAIATGELSGWCSIHAYVLSGQRRIVGCPDVIGPGTYLHEPVDNVDTWEAVGDEPCVIHIEVNGRIEYLGSRGEVVRRTDAATARATYLDWCDRHGIDHHPALASTVPA